MSGAFTPCELELYLTVRLGAAVHEAAVEIEDRELFPVLDQRLVGQSLEVAHKAFVFHLVADTVGLGFIDAPVLQVIDDYVTPKADVCAAVEQTVAEAVRKVQALETDMGLLYGDDSRAELAKVAELAQRLIPEAIEDLRGVIDDVFPIERSLLPATCEQVLKYFWAPKISQLGGKNYLTYFAGAANGQLQWDQGLGLLLRSIAQRRATMAFLRPGLNSTGVEKALRQLSGTPDESTFIQINTMNFGDAVGNAYERRCGDVERLMSSAIVENYTTAHDDAVLAIVEMLGPLAEKIEGLSK